MTIWSAIDLKGAKQLLKVPSKQRRWRSQKLKLQRSLPEAWAAQQEALEREPAKQQNLKKTGIIPPTRKRRMTKTRTLNQTLTWRY
eukprot:symbB.v1.2.031023.t1/scaffold3557.1/size54150/2